MKDAFDVSGLWAVAYKEARHVIRDPATLLFVIAVPLMQLLIYGYAINMHVSHIPAMYVDHDGGRYAATMLRVLRGSSQFSIDGRVGSERELSSALVSGRAHVGFIIPKGFSRDIASGGSATVSMLVDGSDAAVAQAADEGAGAISAAISGWLDPVGEGAAVEVRPRTLFNPTLSSPNFLVPGLIGLVMLNVTMVLTALSVVSERERGSLEQMRALPIGSGAIVLGKLLPFGMIGFFDLLLVLAAMRGVFGVPIAGSVALLLALCVPFLMTGLGIGLLISTIARSQLQAVLGAVFFLLPSFLLSGMFFEVDQMPAPARVISYALPMTYFLEILRAIIIRGAGLADIWVAAVVTVGFGVVSIVVASLRFAMSASG